MLQNNYRFTLQDFSGSLADLGVLSLVTNIAVGFMAGLVLALALNQIVHLQRGVAS